MNQEHSRHVLVTGAYGFLAAHLVEALLARGDRVTGLVRDIPAESYLRSSGLEARITLVSGDLCDPGLVARILNEEEIDTVCHLAAQAIVGLANRAPLGTFESNIRGTYMLLDACREYVNSGGRLAGVVVASSDKAYGDHEVLPYREDAPLLARYPYDVSKACADMLTRAYAVTYGLPAAVTRCANLYGPGDLNFSRLVPETMQAVIEGRRPVIRSDGSPQRDYLFVRDAALGYLAVLDALAASKAAGEAFNLGTGCPVSVLELVQAVITATGQPLEPQILGQTAGEIHHQYLDVSKARKILGWEPHTTQAEGLRVSFDWYKERHARMQSALED